MNFRSSELQIIYTMGVNYRFSFQQPCDKLCCGKHEFALPNEVRGGLSLLNKELSCLHSHHPDCRAPAEAESGRKLLVEEVLALRCAFSSPTAPWSRLKYCKCLDLDHLLEVALTVQRKYLANASQVWSGQVLYWRKTGWSLSPWVKGAEERGEQRAGKQAVLALTFAKCKA